jgi:hypothetical protein
MIDRTLSTLFLIFVALKLTGIGHFSWLVAFSPLLLMLSIWGMCLLIIGLYYFCVEHNS